MDSEPILFFLVQIILFHFLQYNLEKSTIIAINKVKSPAQPEDYRPISLLFYH